MSEEPINVDMQKAIVDEESGEVTAVDQEKREAVVDYNKTTSDGKLSMKVLIYSPYKTYYEGMAFSLSAESETGVFDILPRHHNFISLLVGCDVVVRTASNDEKKIRISGGIIHVKADQVVIFLDV